MNANTAHFAITNTGKLILLGVGANTKEVANLLADNAESVATAGGTPIVAEVLLDIGDLYRLKGEIVTALDNLPNEELNAETETFGTDTV